MALFRYVRDRRCCVLGAALQDGNASVWVQDPKADAFSRQGVQVDFEPQGLITFPYQNTLAFSYSHKRPGGRGTTLWALGWIREQDKGDGG